MGNNETTTKLTAAKYLAPTIAKSETGRVNNNSMVPVLLSSEKERMVIAGIRIKNTYGLKAKKLVRSAVPPSRIFEPPENIHRNSEFDIKKIPMKMYPIIDPKKLLSSLR